MAVVYLIGLPPCNFVSSNKDLLCRQQTTMLRTLKYSMRLAVPPASPCTLKSLSSVSLFSTCFHVTSALMPHKSSSFPFNHCLCNLHSSSGFVTTLWNICFQFVNKSSFNGLREELHTATQHPLHSVNTISVNT